jgi:hypothetical protein
MKMLKKSLIAIAVLAIAMPAFAGKMKIHDPWPTELKKVEVAKIDVIMDVGYWIEIVDQKPIKVGQDTTATNPYATYTGCKKTDVVTNFNVQLILEAAAASTAGGSWSATASQAVLPPGKTNIEICVTGTGVKIEKLIGGSKDVKVAEVTVKVLPAA